MARPLRIQYKDAWYHVMNRGRRRETIFEVENDYQLFLNLLEEAVQKWDINLAAFCLMPNHYHLLLQTPQANLSRFMRHIDGVYTQKFNRKYKLDGQLFRGRYKSILIGEQNYILQLIQYIHFNPVKAGLAKNPGDYHWSSYSAYQDSPGSYNWISRQYIFKILGIKENDENQLKFLNSDCSNDIYKLFSKGKLNSVLGSSEFQDWVKNNFFNRMVHPEVPESKNLLPGMNLILNEVADYFKVSVEDLLKYHRGHVNEAKDIAIYLARELTQKTLAEIGEVFNHLKYSSISSRVENVKQKIKKDSETQKIIDEIITSINKAQTKT